MVFSVKNRLLTLSLKSCSMLQLCCQDNVMSKPQNDENNCKASILHKFQQRKSNISAFYKIINLKFLLLNTPKIAPNHVCLW